MYIAEDIIVHNISIYDPETCLLMYMNEYCIKGKKSGLNEYKHKLTFL